MEPLASGLDGEFHSGPGIAAFWMLLRTTDNLAGHKSACFVCWLMAHGIMPCLHPWAAVGQLNMAESIPARILGSPMLLCRGSIR